MKRTIADSIKASEPLRQAVEETTNLLGIVMNNPPDLVEAVWQYDQDYKGRPFLTLTISDWGSEVSARFSPDELSKPYHLYARLHAMYGDLLQNRSQWQLRKLDQSIKEVVGEV